MERDFTYIDDIVNGVTKIIEKNIDQENIIKYITSVITKLKV